MEQYTWDMGISKHAGEVEMKQNVDGRECFVHGSGCVEMYWGGEVWVSGAMRLKKQGALVSEMTESSGRMF